MKKKEYLNIINEEISGFDYLNNDSYLKEKENDDTLKDKDFQKQFICDSLISTNKIKSKISEANIGGDWEEGNDASNLSIHYVVDIEYKYDSDKKPIIFSLYFDSDNVHINVKSTQDSGDWKNYVAPSNEAHYTTINWDDIDVSLSTIGGEDVEFIAFKDAPFKIKNLFIREYVEHFIKNKTIDTEYLENDNPNNIQYC